MYFIYRIINNINNKSYVGSTSAGKSRWNSHKYYLKNNKHPNQHFQNSWNKYGEKAFTFLILEEIHFEKNSTEEIVKTLLEKEEFYINQIKPEYNIRVVAESNLGLKFSKEVKEKISKSVKSRNKEVWQKSAEANKKPILAYNKEGNFIKEFSSAKDAAVFLNVAPTNITCILKGKGNFIKNIHFKYKTENYPLTIDMSFVFTKRSVAALSNRNKSRKSVNIYKNKELIKECKSIVEAIKYLNGTNSLYQIVDTNKEFNGYTLKSIKNNRDNKNNREITNK